VLYAPTWVDKSGNSSWKKFRRAIIHDKPKNISLIVKLHPNLTRYRGNEVEEIINILAGDPKTLIFDMPPDIVPLTAVSDLLVGDVSSVTREFLAFQRPMVFLSNKPKFFWTSVKKKLWECGEVVTKPEKVWEAVSRSLQNPDNYSDTIKKNFQKTFYKPDGMASLRAATVINDLLRLKTENNYK
jgi:CDP-glycerol glycerophosphotransferase (TagB/SpsB family)